MDQQLARALVAAAIQAPSVHNTQPWRFVAREDRLEVWADPARRLPILDPSGRALHLSCGAALALAEVYAGAHAVGCTLRPFPTAGEPDHLADLVLDGPEGAPQDRDLAEALPVRRTDRRPFDPRPVPAELLSALARAAEHAGCWLKVVESVDDRATVAVALARAEEALAAEPTYRDELAAWTGRDEESGDGLPASATSGPAASERGSSFRLRDFTAGIEQTPADEGGAELPPPAEHPAIVVVGTAADDPSSWLTAGRAVGRLLLTATARGLACSPMTQALEVADTRARLARDLGLVGHPQMVLRVGYPGGPPQQGGARRRAVDDVLTFA